MEGITVDTCSLDGSRQTSYVQLLSLANSDLLSSATSGSKPTIRIQPASLVVQNSSSKKTFAIPSNSNSDFSRLNFDGTRTTETLLCAYDNQQKTLTVLGSTNFARNLFTLPRSEESYRNDAVATVAENKNNDSNKISSKKSSGRYKGGWPKGRRRRKVHPTVHTPKQPATAYNLFCNQRRSIVKLENPDLSLSEIMKILGKEWSSLPKTDKQKFAESAEADMERYKRELNAYKSSAEYQEYLKNKKPTNSFGVSEDIAQTSSRVHNIDDDVTSSTQDLHCKDCDVYFHNIHNKFEHIRGKWHRKNTIKKFEDFWTKRAKSHRNSFIRPPNQFKEPLIMEDVLINFYERNREQELELNELRLRVRTLNERNSDIRNHFHDQSLNLTRLQEELKVAVNTKILLQQQMSKLNSVQTLFHSDTNFTSID